MNVLLRANHGIRVKPNLHHFNALAAYSRSFSASSIISKGHDDKDMSLRSDVRMLGNTLGSIIQSSSPEVFNAVERLRAHGREWRQADGNPAAFKEMVDEIASHDVAMLHNISRAFTHFLSLSNTAENHHRIRRMRARMMETDSALGSIDDSASGCIDKLRSAGHSKDAIFDALLHQKVEIVLTAHPTEVNRRTILEKHARIRDVLQAYDQVETYIPYEIRQFNNQLRREIEIIWDSDELRRAKPTPVEEAEAQGINIVENVLWTAVPDYLRKLDEVCRTQLGKPLPLTYSPLKMASWMGGDRDGNPNVTPEITARVINSSKRTALSLFHRDLAEIHSRMSLQEGNKPLIQMAIDSYGSVPREPYRAVFRDIIMRLEAMIEELEEDPNLTRNTVSETLTKGVLLNKLMTIHKSLHDVGRAVAADGLLTDLIRRVTVFGMSLLPLDIRQESTRHSEALDAITTYLGVGSYLEWDEEKRRDWLQAELVSKRPLLPRNTSLKEMGFSDTVVDTLETFQLLSSVDEEATGAYVISQCQQASDVLAVVLLQIDAGVRNPLRVVPLFETLDDLERSAATVKALFSMKPYTDHIKGSQEIMVGYSDSAKDAGRIAASWAQYNCQVDMIDIANEANIDVTFFHGKGGTVGRGGNPALYKAIMAHPPNTINGRFRVTEQGEMITQNFGHRPVAERTLDIFTSAVLAEKFTKRAPPKQEWKELMDRMSEVSCDAYRQIVRGEPRFVPYFRSATPEQELAGLNVGSRPAKRNPKGGVESLRAIPWVFAWTQTRLNLPAWLGVGTAFHKELSHEDRALHLKKMYAEWPWFSTLVDLLEMILVKSDLAISHNYDKQLVSDKDSVKLGEELRERMILAEKSVLEVVNGGYDVLHQESHGEEEHANLQHILGSRNDNSILMRSLSVRNPYVDPLNIIQAELLKRLRSETQYTSEEEKEEIRDALLITINGVAAGMRNSG